MSKYWTTREGNKIPITEMTDEHSINAIKFLDKRTQEENRENYRFEGDPGVFLDFETRHYFPIYENLCEEAENRGIKY